MKSASLSLLLLLSFLRFTALKKHISTCRITNKWRVVLPRHYSQVIEEQSVETLPCKQSPKDKGKERVKKKTRIEGKQEKLYSFYWTIISGTLVFRCPSGLILFPDKQCIFSKDDAIIPLGNNIERKKMWQHMKRTTFQMKDHNVNECHTEQSPMHFVFSSGNFAVFFKKRFWLSQSDT